jgi:D-3-phosphoglycerate dehydrogenase/glyoxylate/hydroxypyruvate reductase A
MAILVYTHPLPEDSYLAALRAVAPADVPVFSHAAGGYDPAQVQAILAWRFKAGAAAQFPHLRVLCSIGAGVDKLLAPDLPPQVTVTRASDPGQAQQIAQYVVACALRFTRELPLYAQQQAQARWQRHPVRPAEQCRVGVLGQGQVGQAIARAFVPLGYPVAGWSRRPRLGDQAVPGVQGFHGEDGLAALLARTDLLVCALPLTPATQGMLNRATLSLLPRGAFVINVGRGEQLVEADLRALLDEQQLAGAALDVFEREPPAPDNWVWQHPKVLATPHIAGEVSRMVVARQTVDALLRARAGQPQPLAVDRAAGY